LLEEAQNDLQARFTALVAVRRSLGHPVYAIEHGFNEQRIDQLREAASLELRQFGIRAKHWLVWMALAAEAGYRYEGDEYWPEFEFSYGEWRNQTDRSTIRSKFEQFRVQFGGPQPVGDWAQHFSIIAWPIANAVLPKYLQPHFAEHLFHQRFALVDAIHHGPCAVGSLLKDRYRGYSSRFEIFLKQTELTGQIVLALRDQDVGGEQSRIAPDVLARIVRDLGRKSISRTQLQSARKIFSARQAYVAPGLRPSGAPPSAQSDNAALRPSRLAARLEGSVVKIGLIFANVGARLKQEGLSRDLLSSVRICLPGSKQWEPGSALLTYADRDRILEELPQNGIPLVKIECPNPQLRASLESLFTLPPRATQLLKREFDGLYREREMRQVRTGCAYLLVRHEPLDNATLSVIGAIQCQSLTRGAYVYALEIGSHLSHAQRVALESIYVSNVVGIAVEPVGLMARPDDEGFPVWLSSEAIFLSFAADHECDGLEVVLDAEPPRRLVAERGRAFFSIEDVSPGRHSLTIRAVDRHGAVGGPPAEFEFGVRNPEPWQAGMRGKSGFRLALDPPKAKLEALLDHSASITLIGPPDRPAHWTLETFDAAGVLQQRVDGGNLRLGASPQDIGSHIDRLRKKASDAIDSAHRVDIILAIGELGRQALSFETDISPVRWSYDPTATKIRLIDETDEVEPLGLYRYAFERPLVGERINREEALNGILVRPQGALFIAKRTRKPAYMFVHVPKALRLHGFGDLKGDQSFTTGEPPSQAILKLLRAHARWSRGRAVGPQALFQKDMTVDAIRNAICSEACGPEFSALLKHSGLERAQALVGGSPGFGVRMRTFTANTNRAEDLSAFTDCALRYGVTKTAADCIDPFCLAFFPKAFRHLTGEEPAARIKQALSNRSLVLGAFLAKAAAARTQMDGRER
jgi:hypothetical protein